MIRFPRPVFAPEGDAPAAAPVADAAPVAAVPEVAIAAPEPAPIGAPAVEAPAAPVVEAAPVVAATEAAPTNEFPPTAMEAGLPAAEPAKEGEGEKPAKPDAKSEAAPAEPAADKDAAPETTDAPAEEPPAPTYDFTFPEDIKSDSVNKEVMTAFTDLLGKNQVKPEVAQVLLNLHIDQMRTLSNQVQERLSQNQWDVFRQQQNTWLDEIKSDPVLGGSRFQTAMKTCSKVIEQYPGTAEERQAIWNDLRATGMGNSPRFARLFHWLGSKYFSEASMVPASAPRTAQLSPQQRGERRYAGTTPTR
jgi:hypothetical protein